MADPSPHLDALRAVAAAATEPSESAVAASAALLALCEQQPPAINMVADVLCSVALAATTNLRRARAVELSFF